MGVETANRTVMADGRVKERLSNYTSFWEKDSANDNETQKANRLENYADVINGVFNFLASGNRAEWVEHQDTTTVRPSCMNTDGLNHSTSRGFTKERLSNKQ